MFVSVALATLKPQAGIMAPAGGPAVPAQPVNCKFCYCIVFFFGFIQHNFICTFCNLFFINFWIILSLLQAYAAEAGAERAEEPMEEAGMSDEIIQKAGIYCTLYCYN